LLIDIERRWPLDVSSSTRLQDALATGRAQLVPSISLSVQERFARNDDHLRMIRAHGATSVIAVPLQSRGRLLGLFVLNYTRASGRRYRRVDVGLAEELGRRFAQAIDASLLALDAARYQRGIDLLAKVGELLVVELDPERRMQRVTRLVVPDFADLCVVHLREPDGAFRHEKFAVADPEMELVFGDV